ncbi:ABC transporter permease subunit [Brevundimonas sp. PAMC22021]|uniref:DUF3526 domain-containing protein n=1 Tax=Brevundimonas sp. PAMC22021 TaxID=2861285 RepID=UPI001C631B4B|nr:ABC transporter permease subunit [Brevundimonas sp. PAMC22021]QYF87377.1 DUF3526 domain-containing protein [Brevundimonas sp. PAMC22021]
MRRLLQLDAVALSRDRIATAILVVGLLVCAFAALAGHGRLLGLASDRALGVEEAGVARLEARAAWAKAEAGPAAEAVLLPTRLVVPLHLARPVLPDFSAGRSRLEPTGANVRLTSRPDALFTRYQVGNAEAAFRGEIDLAFVATVLAPLLLIGLGYGVFTSDRESGLARLWLAQAGSPLGLLAIRSLNRLTIVFAPILFAAGVLWLAGPHMAERAMPVAVWLGIALLGLLFWWAVILLVNAFARAAETAALVLIGLWTVLVFVVPIASTAVADLLNPLPSRFEQIAAARSTEVRASREYDDDHPELSSATLQGRRATVIKGVEVRRAISDALAPAVARHEARASAQRRLLGWTQLLSPSAVSAEALSRVSRTDAGFYAEQRRAAGAHIEPLAAALADAALGRRPVAAATFDALPRFAPPPTPALSLFPVLWLALVTLILTLWAVSRLRRVSPL